MLIEVSPSIIVWKWFQDKSWPVKLWAGPPDKNTDVVISITDIDGKKDGQLMSGEIIYHPGVQFRSRSRDKEECYTNLAKLINEISKVCRDTVSYKSFVFRIDSFKMSNPPIFIGQEPDSTRYNYTSDGTITVVKLS